MLGSVTVLLTAMLAAADARVLLGDEAKVAIKVLTCDKVKYGYTIDKHPFYKTKANSAHECLNKCRHRHDCHAFEYIDVKKECQFFRIHDPSKVHIVLDVHSPRNAVGVPCKGDVKDVYGGSGNNNGNNSGAYNGNTNGNGGSINSGNYNGNNSYEDNGNVNGNNDSENSGNQNGNNSYMDNGNYNGNNGAEDSGNGNGNGSDTGNGNYNGNGGYYGADGSDNGNGNGNGSYYDNGNNNGNTSYQSGNGNHNGNGSGYHNGNNNGNDGYVYIPTY